MTTFNCEFAYDFEAAGAALAAELLAVCDKEQALATLRDGDWLEARFPTPDFDGDDEALVEWLDGPEDATNTATVNHAYSLIELA